MCAPQPACPPRHGCTCGRLPASGCSTCQASCGRALWTLCRHPDRRVAWERRGICRDTSRPCLLSTHMGRVGPQLLHALPRALVPKLAALIGISWLLTVGFFCVSRTIYESGHLFRARRSLVTLGGVCLQTFPPFLCWVVFVLSLGRESSLYILAKHPSLFCKNCFASIFSRLVLCAAFF